MDRVMQMIRLVLAMILMRGIAGEDSCSPEDFKQISVNLQDGDGLKKLEELLMKYEGKSITINTQVSLPTDDVTTVSPSTMKEELSTTAEFVDASTTECYMGMKSGLIPNSAINASSYWNERHLPYYGRLDNKISGGHVGSWAAKNNDIGEWFQVDFGHAKEIAGVITQGRPGNDYSQWVQTFKVKCNKLQQIFETVQENGQEKIFDGNTDRNTKVYNRFPKVIQCRRIRIYPQTWYGHISMRVEFVSGRCFDNETLRISTRYMGMKSEAIPNTAITASSYFGSGYEPFRARLDNQNKDGNTGSWSAKTSRVGEWWQVDLQCVKIVAGLITQGRPGYDQWVRTYKVSCSKTLTNFITVQQHGTDKVFQANNDRSTKVFNEFPEPLLCRYIRIYPETWNGHISMRVELVAAKNDAVDFAPTSEATANLETQSTDATHLQTTTSGLTPFPAFPPIVVSYGTCWKED